MKQVLGVTSRPYQGRPASTRRASSAAASRVRPRPPQRFLHGRGVRLGHVEDEAAHGKVSRSNHPDGVAGQSGLAVGLRSLGGSSAPAGQGLRRRGPNSASTAVGFG